MARSHYPGAIMLARILIASFSALALTACATKAPAIFSASDACSERSTAFGKQEFQCQLPKTGFAGKFRFKVNFSGGHDDTSGRIEPSIDDAPLACDEGSKMFLSQEDGNVSLWCDFSVADPLQGNGIFRAVVWWGHAEYVNYEFVAQ
jgi:hypothetical protein